ncbi:MAG: hypothetical protein COU31_03280 [Candidatus Magasanikbacteria bacterium CG10_big_fil_rev_8_21_14_0_10_40_10]|uniref:DUF192 domain-containing protein n=1 Tax=Candidatus Magasanikbacteria bacterium CG10_big_fil_rev_8_21_14_0_10_40_10 TaxID=1974648 RepID=A0A2M6W3G9_9BACT|nr:MAG: hypothetical protein COU31_03280 [Candidatus Magasanikbacteria bacterium CG10_big_fil_rev_8_21_14_0_10_40_10]
MKKNKSFKKIHLALLCLMLLFALSIKVYSYYWPKALVQINDQTLRVLVADTARHQFTGLSNRSGLGKFDGMLFIFDSSARHTMVMRDMKFSLDIIWLDNYKVVDIAPNLLPQPNKTEAQLTKYSARALSNMVLELPAGSAQKYGLKIGDIIKISR